MGCKVDATVDIAVEGQGGTVTARFALDREAAEVLGDDFEETARVADLRKAGWEVGPLRRRASGATASLSKRFGRPGDLTRVVAELSGPDGPLREFRLRRSRGLTGSVRYRLTGRLALDDPAALTGFDAGGRLAERAQAAGIDPGKVRDLLEGRAKDGLDVTVSVDLPGKAPETTSAKVGRTAAVRASSSVRQWGRLAALAVAAALAGLAAVVLRGGRRTA